MIDRNAQRSEEILHGRLSFSNTWDGRREVRARALSVCFSCANVVWRCVKHPMSLGMSVTAIDAIPDSHLVDIRMITPSLVAYKVLP